MRQARYVCAIKQLRVLSTIFREKQFQTLDVQVFFSVVLESVLLSLI